MTDLADLAGQLDLASTEPYLRSRGWELMHQGELGNRWRYAGDERTRNIAVPLFALDAEDRTRMLTVVLGVLSEVEERDPHDVAVDVGQAASDLVEFRMIAASLHAGEMPLRAAPELTSGAYGAMVAAARAEIQRRPHWTSGNLPTDVRTFVDSAVLAGTRRGSVILQVRTPPPSEPSAPRLEGMAADPDPFDRRAVRRLIDATRAAKSAAHMDPTAVDNDALDRSVEDGLSANLCDSLLRLAGTETKIDAKVEMRVRWALTRPAPEPVTTVALERTELGQLGRLGEMLREIQPVPNTTVRGPVIQVRHEPGDDEIQVLMRAEIDDRVRVVRAYLDCSELDPVQSVMSNEGEIELTGTMERAGTIRELTEPTDMRIVQ